MPPGGMNMNIEVLLSADDFKRFTYFDVLRRRKMWRSPAIFASILGVCACICFLMNHVDGAVMLGSVLLIVGLGMPLTYFLNFYLSLRGQVKTLGLTRPQKVYTLCLTQKPKGIAVSNEKESAEYQWKDVHHVYRDTFATYLYMTAARGFILPHSCVAEGDDALWQLMEKMVSADRRTVLHK